MNGGDRPSIERLADQVVADDVTAGRPGKSDTRTSGGPRLGCLLWILLVVIALVVGLLVGTHSSEDNATSSEPTTEPRTTPTSRTVPTTTTVTTVPPAVSATNVTGGWDHPPLATTYLDARTGQPVTGNSIVLACMTIRGAATNSVVVVTWTAPGGSVTGTGRVNQSGQVVAAGGILTPGNYQLATAQVAPPTNPNAFTNVSLPPVPATTVTLPADSICTP